MAYTMSLPVGLRLPVVIPFLILIAFAMTQYIGRSRCNAHFLPNGMGLGEMARCAAGGRLMAQVEYGHMLIRDGQLVEAETWFETAVARHGSSAADVIASRFVPEHRGSDNVQAAEHWYRRGHKLGSDWAAVHLGLLFRKRGNAVEAGHWFERAVERDGGRAATRIAYNINRSQAKNHAEQDAIVRVQWFRRAAALGDQSGMRYLAEALSAGNGVAQDEAEAFRWYEAAARHPEADGYDLFTLAKLHVNGKGTPRNPATAIPVLRAAKEKKFDDSDTRTLREITALEALLATTGGNRQ